MAGKNGGVREGAGRPKGSKNKWNTAMAERLEELDCDPIRIIADLANDPNSRNDIKLAAAKELVQYTHPKRRSLEVTGEGGGPVSINVIESGKGRSHDNDT